VLWADWAGIGVSEGSGRRVADAIANLSTNSDSIKQDSESVGRFARRLMPAGGAHSRLWSTTKEVILPRRPRSPADIEKAYDEHEDIELIAAVCRGFCEGQSGTKVREEVERKLGRKLSREEPYKILSFAGIKGWLEFVPPLEHKRADEIRWNHPLLESVEVVNTKDPADVAARAARTLLQLVRQRAHGREIVHVGLAGGWTVLLVVQSFAKLLSLPMSDLPRAICFHAMVTGLQANHPETDPNTFFNFLSSLPLETSFIALHGPALPTAEMIEQLRAAHVPTQRAFEREEEIDIIVTSGSSWKDGDSQLRNLMLDYKLEEEVAKLEKRGCVGDVLWQPIDRDGPIPSEELEVGVMTLTQLSNLPQEIEEGKKVLLVLGPCGLCRSPRGDLLQALLGFEKRYLTHLVTDVRTAAFESAEVGES
jgi:DNA-binding transcriptional regulator LsrR (DeoR family)